MRQSLAQGLIDCNPSYRCIPGNGCQDFKKDFHAKKNPDGPFCLSLKRIAGSKLVVLTLTLIESTSEVPKVRAIEKSP